jgi:ubiquinone/menaquinone biosynthesis C-methylase UbiE
MARDEVYGHGHHRGVVGAHARRTVADSASYFAPHLTPGMRLLDAGSGPGSITCEMAELVAPGEVVGIDNVAEVVEQARALAAERGVANVRFEVGDTYALGYDDDSFDGAHAHQLLQHVSDPVTVLRELSRVVRPRGVVAARDADYATMVHSPHFDGITRWNRLYRDVARRAGGEPEAGRRIMQWFVAAGLEVIHASSSTWTFATPEDRRWWADSWISRLLDARLGELAVEYGMAERSELEEMAADWERWAAHPTGYFTFLHGEIVAVNP